jgi:hypothetical protein
MESTNLEIKQDENDLGRLEQQKLIEINKLATADTNLSAADKMTTSLTGEATKNAASTEVSSSTSVADATSEEVKTDTPS